MRRIQALALLTLLSAVPAAAFDPVAGDFAKATPGALRVMSYNVEKHFITDPTRDDEFKRIFEAIAPDVIVFNEIDDSLGSAAVAAAAIKARLETYAPAGTWFVWAGISDGFNRNAVASRHPLSMQITDTTPASEVRGVTAALVDLPSGTWGTTDLYLMGVHMKSGGTTGVGGDHQRRQVHADALVRWMADARTAGGSITLPANTPMVIAGDTNLGFNDQGDEAPYHASRTLLDGDIFDNATYGPDSSPDWDGTTLREAAPYDHTNAEPRTQPSSSPDSRFDRIIYTDSVLRVENRFLLRTATMTSGALSAAGLLAGDSVTAADHLPVIVDFLPGAAPAPGDLRINEFIFNDVGTDDRNFVEIINVGGEVVNLDAPADFQLKVSSGNCPTSPPGSNNQASFVDLKGIVPPGGLFVVYNAAGESSAVAGTIVSNLPSPIQRQNSSSLALTEGDNTALALVTRGRSSVTTTLEANIDAYLYAATTPGTTRYFRTSSNNGLTIALPTGQQTTFGAGGAASDASLSRNVGDGAANSFAGWSIPNTATPGLPNAVTSVGDWMLFE